MNKGFALIPIIVVLAISAIGGAVGVVGMNAYLTNQEPTQEATLGTSERVSYTGTILPIVDSVYDLGTTSQAYNAYFNDITVNGTCTGCGAGLSGGFAGMMAAWADATTLISTSTIVGDVFHGTSTTATSTIPWLTITHLSASSLTLTDTLEMTGLGTSTIDLLQGTSADFTNLQISGDLNVTSGATSTLPLIRVTSADVTNLQISGDLNVTSSATSTLPLVRVTAADITGLTVSGQLDVTTGTSTFQGANFTGLYTTNGLRVDSGVGIFDEAIEAGSGTSTFAGTLSIDSGGTGTSTFSNASFNSVNITGGIYTNIASTTNVGTTTLTFDCALGKIHTAITDRDATVRFKNCFGGQSLILWIDNPRHEAGADHQLDWDGLPDANGEYGSTTMKFDKTNGSTTTPGYLGQGYTNIFGVLFATTSDNQAAYGVLTESTIFGEFK